jgi:hypothetical protein
MHNPEDRFLASRQQREQERAVAREATATDSAAAREIFNASVHDFVNEMKGQLACDTPDLTAGLERWRVMQAKVADSSQTLRLTAHDVRQANAALAMVLNDIENIKAKNSAKTFRFSRAVRPMGTSFRQRQDFDRLGLAADVCARESDGATTVADLRGESRVFAEDSTAQFVRRCRDCTFHFVPISGSCFLSDCHDCIVYVACHQLRINNCSNCEIYVWCRSTPVIEKSTGMRFGGYEAWTTAHATLSARDGPGALHTITEYATAAGLEDAGVAQSAHERVDDFTWLRQQASPNWEALDRAQWRHSNSIK